MNDWSASRLYLYLSSLTEGQRVNLEVARRDRTFPVALTARVLPHVCERAFALIDTQSNFIEVLGILTLPVVEGPDQSVPASRVPTGVVVAALVDTPRAASVDLLKGDLILAVNGIIVNKPVELRDAVVRIGRGAPVVLQVERSGRLSYVAFEQP